MTLIPHLIPSDATKNSKFYDPKILEKLPKGVYRWLKMEQDRLSLEVDITKSPIRNFQETDFKPETGSVLN